VKSILRRRPSPALVISCIALFVSLGGVSYGVATGFIDSREIKNNEIRSADVRNNQLRTFDIRNNEVRGFDIRNSTIQGRDVAFNTLTGADISEQDLAKVPSAALADTATSAGSVGGVTLRKFAVKRGSSAPVAEIVRGPGFALEAGCTATQVEVQLDGVAGGPETHARWNVDTEPGAGAVIDSDADLQPGDDADLLGGQDLGFGRITISTTGGQVSVVEFAARNGASAFTGESGCAISGILISG
jgi:hypothetical protein